MADEHEHDLVALKADPAVKEATSGAEGIRIVRILPAPPELVFTAWTTPEHFSQWFGEDGSELPVELISMDVGAGGRWSCVMYHGPDRVEIPFAGGYLVVDPPLHLVQTLDDPGGSGAVEVMTVDLTDLGDGTTEMVFTQTGGNLPADEYERAMTGELVFFTRLDRLLRTLSL
jgi:uncharacterized protein YndB with AHSA1/START domain